MARETDMRDSGITMGWLLRLVTGGPTGGWWPLTVLEFLVINFSVCLVLVSNCYIITTYVCMHCMVSSSTVDGCISVNIFILSLL